MRFFIMVVNWVESPIQFRISISILKKSMYISLYFSRPNQFSNELKFTKKNLLVFKHDIISYYEEELDNFRVYLED